MKKPRRRKAPGLFDGIYLIYMETIIPLAVSFVSAFVILAVIMRGSYAASIVAAAIFAVLSYMGNFGIGWSALGWLLAIFFLIKFIKFSFAGALLFVFGQGIAAYLIVLAISRFL